VLNQQVNAQSKTDLIALLINVFPSFFIYKIIYFAS